MRALSRKPRELGFTSGDGLMHKQTRGGAAIRAVLDCLAQKLPRSSPGQLSPVVA
jgi:hypothetical protein